jgi:uncharacterized peroxidase-related enzyme
MNDTAFVSHTVESAPAEVKPHLVRARQQFGFIPGPLARMATSPGLVEAFNATLPIFETRSSLTALEREVVVMVVSRHNGCEYCVALHSAQLRRHQAPAELVEALRAGQAPADPRLAALAAFAERLLATRGAVGEAALRAFLEAGYTRQQALDVVLAIGVFTLTTYANRLTGVPLDPPFEPFRWTAPA